MSKANLDAARHQASKQQSQNKKLFSDIARGAFVCYRRGTPCTSSKGAHSNDILKFTLQRMSDTSFKTHPSS